MFERGAAPGLDCSPGCEDLWRSDVGHHVQEVVAHEDSSLQQEEGKADAVPDDPSLLSMVGKLTDVVSWKVTRNLH